MMANETIIKEKLTLGGRPLILRLRLAGGRRAAGVGVHLALIALRLQVPRAESAQRLR